MRCLLWREARSWDQDADNRLQEILFCFGSLMARQGRSVRLGELGLRRTVGSRQLNSMIPDDPRFHWHSYLHSKYFELAFQPRSNRSKLFIYPLTFFGEPTLSSAPSAAPYWELRSPINSTGEDDLSDAFRFLLPFSLPFCFWSALSIGKHSFWASSVHGIFAILRNQSALQFFESFSQAAFSVAGHSNWELHEFPLQSAGLIQPSAVDTSVTAIEGLSQERMFLAYAIFYSIYSSKSAIFAIK